MSVADLIAQLLLVSRSDANIAADRDGVICFWNPGADRIFGSMRGEAIGRSLDLIIPERLRQRHWDGYRATIATGSAAAICATSSCVRYVGISTSVPDRRPIFVAKPISTLISR